MPRLSRLFPWEVLKTRCISCMQSCLGTCHDESGFSPTIQSARITQRSVLRCWKRQLMTYHHVADRDGVLSTVAHGRYGKPLRIAEANSISNSGRDGVSNVFASALWALDMSMETATAGESDPKCHLVSALPPPPHTQQSECLWLVVELGNLRGWWEACGQDMSESPSGG